MNTLTSTIAAAGPLAAGWSAHGAWLGHQIKTARRDPLTGLMTRAGFEARARRLVHRGNALVLLADVNDFKAINDTMGGHPAGDAVLAAIGRRLSTTWAQKGAVGRLGGDEFAAAFQVEPARVDAVLGALHRLLCVPVEHDSRRLAVSVSIGAALVGPTKGAPADVLSCALRCADEAMYAAKRADGGWRVVSAATLTSDSATVNGRRLGRPGADSSDLSQGRAR